MLDIILPFFFPTRLQAILDVRFALAGEVPRRRAKIENGIRSEVFAHIVECAVGHGGSISRGFERCEVSGEVREGLGIEDDLFSN